MMKNKKWMALLMLGAWISGLGGMVAPGSTAEAAEVTQTARLKLMTFNVRNLHGDDGTINSWDNRKDKAVNVINSFGPDIVGMQEAYAVQIDYFISHLNGNYQSLGTSRYGNKTDEYSNIVYRADKFHVLESGQFWLSETPDAVGSLSSFDDKWPRICTWAKFQAKDDPRTVFYYFNTHFSLNSSARALSSQLILNRVSEYVTSPDTPVFIGGDLNSPETESAYSILEQSDFSDVWTQSGHDFNNASTVSNYNGNTTGHHIDWIFQRGAGTVESMDINRYNENGLYPSDHYPVQLTIQIPRTAKALPAGYVNVAAQGTATADGYVQGEAPNKAIDGTVLGNSKWCATGTEPHWLQIDLGKRVNLYRFVVKHAAAGGETPSINTRNFKIQVSDNGSAWTDAAAVTGNTRDITLHDVNTFGRYIRVYITDAGALSTDTSARIYELEAYGLDKGAVFYKDGSYGGYAVSLAPGSYTLAALLEAGIQNDDITSLRVFGGAAVELYEHDNFQGAKLVRTADDSSLTPEGWSDRTSSILIN
ncbi:MULTISPECIES: discoidin domain-containing protein [unclassified Paenibacillus]|uniref:discoidin domain-containing protein n=1 Tax=unclassified Paenibacillus TaxID=185978 RepID=UPI0004F67A1D|nr:discoidin domain-containing protein [Paenibacillus sp. FSL R5-0912]AIQ43229.1 hypothetical protein R50912_26740 [Paenibacillus sp. FSL R5-0912]